MTALPSMLSPGTSQPIGITAERYSEVFDRYRIVARTAASPAVKLDDVLRLAGEFLCSLLGVARCSVYLRQGDGKFQGRVAFCTTRQNIDSTASRRITGHDRFTAEIVNSAAPLVVADASRDVRTVQRAMRLWRVKDVVGIPLVADDQVIGIMYADDAGNDHTFSSEDMNVAQMYSNLIAYVIKQVWLLQQAEVRASTAEREVLANHRVAEVRREIIKVLGDGGAIADVMSTLANFTGKPVVRYSENFVALGWQYPDNASPRLKGVSPALKPAELKNVDVTLAFARFAAGAKNVVLRNTPDRRCRRMFVKLSDAENDRGYLELCELGAGFNHVDSTIMEETASILRLKFSLVAEEVPSAVSVSEFIRDIVQGRLSEEALRERAQAAGINQSRRHALMCFEPPSSTFLNVLADDLIQAVNKKFESRIRVRGSLTIGSHCLVLCEVDDGLDRSGFREAAAEVWADLRSATDSDWAVSSYGAGKFNDLRLLAPRLFDLMELVADRGVVDSGLLFADDFELLRLATAGGGMRNAVVAANEVLNPIREYDRQHAAHLFETLRVFVDCGAQFRLTATSLGVHENTVRYRLTRIAEIGSIDPTNLHDLSRAAFALQVEKLIESQGTKVNVPPVT